MPGDVRVVVVSIDNLFDNGKQSGRDLLGERLADMFTLEFKPVEFFATVGRFPLLAVVEHDVIERNLL